MWYIIQVYTGREEECRELIISCICSQLIEDCKIPKYVSTKKYGGNWYKELKILFPGYIFVKTDKVKKLYLELKKIPEMTKLLGTGREIIPISNDEQRFLFAIGRENLIVEMSKGMIQDKKVRVTEGPLLGLEDYIIKVDKHKRQAWIKILLSGKQTVMRIGMEITE